MADGLTQNRDQLVADALRRYGLRPAKFFPPQKGYRNESHPVQLASGRLVNLIIYKREPGIVATIKHLNAVTTYLAAHDLPVRAPIDSRILTILGAGITHYASLYTYLPGDTIPWESYTQKHLKLLGKTLSDLHTALRTYKGKDLPFVVDIYGGIVQRMAAYFADDHVQQAVATKLDLHVPHRMFDRAARLLHLASTLPDQQVLHMDFVRSNILFSPADNEFGLMISGILDFEKIAVGHRIFDIARTLAFLIVDCKYKQEAKVRKYFLQSGYDKRGKQHLPQLPALLEELINVFLLYDLYKFLRHNPYEYLYQNEHFVRTRDILLARGVITTTTRYG